MGEKAALRGEPCPEAEPSPSRHPAFGAGLVGVLALALGPAAWAAGDETSARAALETALVRAETEVKTAPRLAFTETVAEKGVTVAARFDPKAAPNRAWTLVSPSPPLKGQTRKTYDGILADTPDERDLFLDRIRASLGDRGRYEGELDGVAAFDFALAPDARPTHSPLDGALNLAQHIRLKAWVDIAQGRFQAIRFYAPAAFSATPLAHVDHITLDFTFAPAFPAGPVVVARIDTDARYRIAGIVGIVRDTVWFSDVVGVPGAPIRRLPTDKKNR